MGMREELEKERMVKACPCVEDTGSCVVDEDRSKGLYEMWRLWWLVNKERVRKRGFAMRMNGDEFEVRVGDGGK